MPNALITLIMASWSTPLYGLRLTAPQTTVRGLSIDHFAKYDLLLEGSHESVIEGNYLGIDATARMFIGSAINGVQVLFLEY